MIADDGITDRSAFRDVQEVVEGRRTEDVGLGMHLPRTSGVSRVTPGVTTCQHASSTRSTMTDSQVPPIGHMARFDADRPSPGPFGPARSESASY